MMCIVPLAMNHERFFLYSVLLIDQYNISRYLSLSILVYTLIQEQSHAVAKPIEAFEDVLVSAGLYDPEDEDSEDMGDFVAKKDNNKKV